MSIVIWVWQFWIESKTQLNYWNIINLLDFEFGQMGKFGVQKTMNLWRKVAGCLYSCSNEGWKEYLSHPQDKEFIRVVFEVPDVRLHAGVRQDASRIFWIPGRDCEASGPKVRF